MYINSCCIANIGDMPYSPVWHILASPGYAPGTITVNVTWVERGFNAGQTHSSIYTHLSSTVYEL